MDRDDHQLLAEYVQHRSESAFAELVERHLNLVFSTALRRTNDRSLAEEISQKVFLLLAQKARLLRTEQILSGWLYRAAARITSETLRAERRRNVREIRAMETMYNSSSENSNEARMAPILDEAMAALSESDRNSILLRYFEDQPLAQVAQAMGVSEDAAQKRVARALDRMRGWFARRGVCVSSSALAAVLSGMTTASTAPPALAASISALVASGAVAEITGIGLLTAKLTSLMNIKTGLGIAAAVATTTVFVQQARISALRQETQQLAGALRPAGIADNNLAAPDNDSERLRREAAEVHRLRGQLAQLLKEKQELQGAREELARLQAQSATVAEQSTDPEPDEDDFKRAGIMKLNHAKDWMMAFWMYAENNNDVYPESFENAARFHLKDDDGHLKSLDSGLNKREWEIVFTGNRADIAAPSRTIVIREKEPWPKPEGGWGRTYGFADGHSEIHFSADGNFERFEAERTAQAAAAPPSMVRGQ